MKKDNTVNRLFYIDFIRAVSLLIIIQCHFDAAIAVANHESSTAFAVQYKNFDTGSLGVALFVMVSGASLMLSYGGHLDLREFYYRRFLAIFPLFWTAWFLAQAFNILTAGHLQGAGAWWTPVLTIAGFDGFLLYAGQNYYIVGEWFIGMILCLYLIFPALRWAVNKSALGTLFAALVLAVVIHHFYTSMFTMSELRQPLILMVFMVFGMVFVRFFPRMGCKCTIASLIALVVVCTVWIKIPYTFSVLLVSAIAFCALALIGERFRFGVTTRAHVATVAKYSYPAFLVHHVLINWLASLHPTSVFERFEVWWVFLVAVGLALIGGYVVNLIANRFVVPYFPKHQRR